MDVIFPSSVGILVRSIRAGLTASDSLVASQVTVQPKLPEVKKLRMVTVRDDSGPDDGSQSRRRFGCNVWAESPTVAEDLALLCMAVVRGVADGKPVTLVDQMSGPFEVIDETTDLYSVGGKTLSHYYFSGRVSVRGSSY